MSRGSSLSASPAMLVCCDLQEDCRPANMEGRLVVITCRELLAKWRELRWPVAHLKWVGDAWLRMARPSDWIDAFRPRPDELTFEHELPSAYSSAHFDEYMRGIRDTTCVLVGFSLDRTILATAVEGFHRGHRYYLATDAVACAPSASGRPDQYMRSVASVVQNFTGTFHGAETWLPQPSTLQRAHDRPADPSQRRSS